MIQESEPREIKVTCGEVRDYIIDRLHHRFDDELVEFGSDEFAKAVAVGNHANSCPSKICQFLGWTLHTRNGGTEIDLDATMRRVAELQSQEDTSA